MKDNKVIENSQQAFTKWKPLTNQIALYDEAAMKDEVRAVDIAYFIFRKAFDSVFCKILIQKLKHEACCQQDEQKARWIENRLTI